MTKEQKMDGSTGVGPETGDDTVVGWTLEQHEREIWYRASTKTRDVIAKWLSTNLEPEIAAEVSECIRLLPLPEKPIEAEPERVAL